MGYAIQFINFSYSADNRFLDSNKMNQFNSVKYLQQIQRRKERKMCKLKEKARFKFYYGINEY